MAVDEWGGRAADLTRVDGKVPVGRWHHPGPDPWHQAWMRFGYVEGRGWWVDHTGYRLGWAYPDEAGARARLWLLAAEYGPGWEELEPAYDPRFMPGSGRLAYAHQPWFTEAGR